MLIEKFTGNGIIIDAALGGQIATNADVGPIVDRIENCHVFSNGGCGILGNQATAVVVERCRIEGNSQWGLRLRGNGMSVDGNAIESNGDVKGPGNLRIEAASGGTIDASVTNNYFGTVSGQIAPAISVEGNQNGGVSRAFISGNYLVGNQVSKSYAIVVGTENTRGSSGVGNPTASNVTIVGNFIGGFQTGVWIGEGTDRYVVGPNGFASGLAGATENLVPTPMLPGRSAGVFKWTTG